MVKQWKKSLDGDDVQAEAEDALEKDISQMSPANNSVAANLDGGVAAVDWSSKSPKMIGVSGVISIANDFKISVSGSGYLLSINVGADDATDTLGVEIDGVQIIDEEFKNLGAPFATNREISFSSLFRFESGFKLGSGSNVDDGIRVGGAYVLD